MQTISLGNEHSPWIYDIPEETLLSLASMVQQISRVGRIFPSNAYLLTKELQDFDSSTFKVKPNKPPKDLSYQFSSLILSRDKEEIKKILTHLKNKGINMGDGQNFAQAAVALRYHFGKKIERVLVGLGGVKPTYPTYKNEPVLKDSELWNWHLGKPTPPKVNKEKAKELALMVITGFFEEEQDITKNISISFSDFLIENAWGNEVVKGDGKVVIEMGEKEKEAAVGEIRKAAHAFFDSYRNKLNGYEEGKMEYLENEKDTFDKLVGLYKVVNGLEIKTEAVLDKDKNKTVININYPLKKNSWFISWTGNRSLKVLWLFENKW
ncbi:MAG: hypothetical protein GBAus27B_000325 [Mycoplasmataceae bacterium]|nr:MAG: hypothetical protein GBAus27B_000325 [Mycoplasmataceae bacterium]